VTLSATAIGEARAHARHQIPAMTSLARSFEGRALKEQNDDIVEGIIKNTNLMQIIRCFIAGVV
jgi:hypothetical protein